MTIVAETAADIAANCNDALDSLRELCRGLPDGIDRREAADDLAYLQLQIARLVVMADMQEGDSP